MRTTTQSKKVIASIAITCLLFLLSHSVNAENFYQIEAGVTIDDNLGLATEKLNFRRDQKINTFVSYGYFKSLENGKSFTANGFAEMVAYNTHDQLNHFDIGAQVSFEKKIGLGDFAPTWSLGASLLKRGVKSNIRDAWVYSINAGFNKLLNDYWGIFSQLNYNIENADYSAKLTSEPDMMMPAMTNNNVFDLDNFSWVIGAEYAINNQHFLKLGYTYRTGEVASLGRPTDPVTQYFTAVISDSVFAENVNDNLWMYRIDADSHIIQLGWDIALSDNSAVSFSFDYQKTSGNGGLEYDRNVYAIKYIYSR